MNKKELILVAILVNVGVLVFLVVSSIEPAISKKEKTIKLTKIEEPLVLEVKEGKSKGDSMSEVDRVVEAVALLQNPAAPSTSIKQAETPQDILKPFLSQDLSEVVIKSGDSLAKLANEYRVSIEEIMRFNELKGSNLQIGQTLYIPKKKSPASVETPSLELSGERYYIVKTGDSPWTIATKNHIKLEELLRLNNLDNEKAKRLKAGDRLRIK